MIRETLSDPSIRQVSHALPSRAPPRTGAIPALCAPARARPPSRSAAALLSAPKSFGRGAHKPLSPRRGVRTRIVGDDQCIEPPRSRDAPSGDSSRRRRTGILFLFILPGAARRHERLSPGDRWPVTSAPFCHRPRDVTECYVKLAAHGHISEAAQPLIDGRPRRRRGHRPPEDRRRR
jgi:hypothetical protein